MKNIACPVCNGTNTRLIWTLGVVERCRFVNKATSLSPPGDDNLTLRCDDCGREVYAHDGRIIDHGDSYDLLDHVEDRSKVVITTMETGDPSQTSKTHLEYEEFDPDDERHGMAEMTEEGYLLIAKRRPDDYNL